MIRIKPPKTPVWESNKRIMLKPKKDKGKWKRKRKRKRSIEEITGEEGNKQGPNSNKVVQSLIFTSPGRLVPGGERPNTNSISIFVPSQRCVFVRNEQDLLKTQNLKTQKKPRPKDKGKENCIISTANNLRVDCRSLRYRIWWDEPPPDDSPSSWYPTFSLSCPDIDSRRLCHVCRSRLSSRPSVGSSRMSLWPSSGPGWQMSPSGNGQARTVVGDP